MLLICALIVLAVGIGMWFFGDEENRWSRLLINSLPAEGIFLLGRFQGFHFGTTGLYVLVYLLCLLLGPSLILICRLLLQKQKDL